MAQKDMKLNREIQQTLARQDINQKPIRYTVQGGQLKFSGLLEKQRGSEITDSSEVEKLEQQVKRINGVIKVQWDLENWSKTDDGWVRE